MARFDATTLRILFTHPEERFCDPTTPILYTELLDDLGLEISDCFEGDELVTNISSVRRFALGKEKYAEISGEDRLTMKSNGVSHTFTGKVDFSEGVSDEYHQGMLNFIRGRLESGYSISFGTGNHLLFSFRADGISPGKKCSKDYISPSRILENGLKAIESRLSWLALLAGGEESRLSLALAHIAAVFQENSMEGLLPRLDAEKFVRWSKDWPEEWRDSAERYALFELPIMIQKATLADRLYLEPALPHYDVLIRIPRPVLEGETLPPYTHHDCMLLPPIHARVKIDPDCFKTKDMTRDAEKAVTFGAQTAIGTYGDMLHFTPYQGGRVVSAARTAFQTWLDAPFAEVTLREREK